MATTAGKRAREQQKLERARAKAERRAARQTGDESTEDLPEPRSESEIVEDLGALQRSFEAGEVSPEEFEERRERLLTEFGQIS
jgi:hypothetical protein